MEEPIPGVTAADDDDEELDELELRRNALASLLAEAKEETGDRYVEGSPAPSSQISAQVRNYDQSVIGLPFSQK